MRRASSMAAKILSSPKPRIIVSISLGTSTEAKSEYPPINTLAPSFIILLTAS